MSTKNYNSNLQNNNNELQEILDSINSLPDYEPGIDTTSATATAADILAGKTAYAKGEEITGTIPTQAAKTITPNTSNQTAVSSGYYTGGDVIVKGDSNLVASNIASGKSIFGVTGTFEGGENLDTEISNINAQIASIKNALDGKAGLIGPIDDISKELIEGTLTEISSNEVTIVNHYAFYSYSNLVSVNFPLASMIGGQAFRYCSNLTTINFPMATCLSNYAFGYCSNLTSINCPLLQTIGYDTFKNCTKLMSVSFPEVIDIRSNAFQFCSNLISVNCPATQKIYDNAFQYCDSLISINFPVATSVGIAAFHCCYNLKTVSVPMLTTIKGNSFGKCSNLTALDFPAATSIFTIAFQGCYRLLSLTLANPTVCTLNHSDAFSSTPIAGYTDYTSGVYGSIYVPASLVDAYKSATNWTYFADRITAIT